MSDVLAMPRSLDEAVANAMIAIEKGNFDKVINLLEYVIEYKKDYDEVMVNYALLISYMNTSQISSATECLTRLEQMEIYNPQIEEVLKAIKKDIIKLVQEQTPNEDISFDEIVTDLGYTPEDFRRISFLYKQFGEGTVWSNLSNKEELDELQTFYHIYKQDYNAFKNIFLRFEGFDDTVTPLDMFETMKRIEDSDFFWFNFSKTDLLLILQNKKVPQYAKNFMIERVVNYTQLKMIEPIELTFGQVDEKISTLELPLYHREISVVKDNLISLYQDEIQVDYDTLDTMIESVLLIIMTDNYPKNIFTNLNEITAICGYIVNDIFLGRNYDSLIKAYTNLSFTKVKSKIQKYEMLISFLIT